uniref:Uncharacterized protein n=1 Tax=Arundo donax TaxID=35708 RepID=A0A0A9FUM2_ARUDO
MNRRKDHIELVNGAYLLHCAVSKLLIRPLLLFLLHRDWRKASSLCYEHISALEILLPKVPSGLTCFAGSGHFRLVVTTSCLVSAGYPEKLPQGKS